MATRGMKIMPRSYPWGSPVKRIRSPEASDTEALTTVVADALSSAGVEVEWVRAADPDFKPGVNSDEGDGDEWPPARERVLLEAG